MGTPTYYYVDPAAGTDDTAGGRGDTAGDPWASVQWALDNITRDATNGDQINVKAGSDDVLSSALDISGTYGTPGFSNPLIIRGYGSVANDGSSGGISGNGSVSIHDTSTQALHFADMHLHNCGSANIAKVGIYGSVSGCEIDNTTGGGIVLANTYGKAVGNYVYNVQGVGISASSRSHILYNFLKNGTNDFSSAIASLGDGGTAAYNIISIDGASNGINANGNNFGLSIIQNSVLSAGGTGSGIIVGADELLLAIVLNNICEGFSDTSGLGFEWVSGSRNIHSFAHNAAYNNLSDFSGPDSGEVIYNLVDNDNEELGASPFAKSGSDTFANRFTYFAPVDTGNVHGGAYPSGSRIDKGAVQHADPAGGGVLAHPGMSGGLRS